MLQKIKEITTQINQQNPLILNMTNAVTMDFVANGLLSVGASPIMSNALEEITDLTHIAQSVVINLGTLNERFIKLCHHTCKVAQELDKPIILDPVGAGASRLRTETARHLLAAYPIAIVRGNASEILALTGSAFKTKGVDSQADSSESIVGAKMLSQLHGATIAVSGKVDVIVDGEQIDFCHHGSRWMPLVTGTGCLLSSIVAAFHAVHRNRFEATVSAMHFYGLSGEKAGLKATGPGSFKIKLIDALNTWS